MVTRVSRCRARRSPAGAAAGATPRPAQRRDDALDPAGPAPQRRRDRAAGEQPLGRDALGLDQLLVGAGAAAGGGGAGGLRRPGAGPQHRGGEPLAGRGDAAGVPVGDAAAVLLVAELLGGGPERGELGPRYPDVGRRDAGDVRVWSRAPVQGAAGADVAKQPSGFGGRRRRLRVAVALKAARAEELPIDPPSAGRSCRPGAEHGRPQRQGCCASAAPTASGRP